MLRGTHFIITVIIVNKLTLFCLTLCLTHVVKAKVKPCLLATGWAAGPWDALDDGVLPLSTDSVVYLPMVLVPLAN